MFQWLVVTVAVLFLLFGLSILSQAYPDFVACRQAANWPTTKGVVDSSSIVESTNAKGSSTYGAEVIYSYSVGGRKFSGINIAHGYEFTSNRRTHETIVDLLPESTVVKVRYNPDEPQYSTLSYGLHRSMIVKIGFLAVWFTIVPLIAAAIIMDSSFDKKLIDNITVVVEEADAG